MNVGAWSRKATTNFDFKRRSLDQVIEDPDERAAAEVAQRERARQLRLKAVRNARYKAAKKSALDPLPHEWAHETWTAHCRSEMEAQIKSISALRQGNADGRFDGAIFDMRKKQVEWEAKWMAALMAHQETLPDELILARIEERRREAKRASNRRSARRKKIMERVAEYLKHSQAAEAVKQAIAKEMLANLLAKEDLQYRPRRQYRSR